MIRCAMVEDSQSDRNALKNCLQRYAKERDVEINVKEYEAPLAFLEDFEERYDVVFLDVEMPGADGVEVARALRSRRSRVALIFITNMEQYAMQGYEVQAVDYLLKPVQYASFRQRFARALDRIGQSRPDQILLEASCNI